MVQIYLEQQDGTIIIKERELLTNCVIKNEALKMCIQKILDPENSQPRMYAKEIWIYTILFDSVYSVLFINKKER